VEPTRPRAPNSRWNLWPSGVDNEGVAALSDDEVRDGLARLPGWRRDGDEIVRDYELPTFLGVIDFVQRIAALAEAANHHPDLDIRYNRLRVALTTHDEGGLSERDLKLAGEIEAAAGAWKQNST
jgi:4a-hydroxytetrahydrobiopterin dehydratase